MPPYVQTTLMGERQANDPQAMPLDEFIAEVMQTCRGRAKSDFRFPLSGPPYSGIPLRLAAEAGQEQYDKFFDQFNDRMHK